MAIGANTACFTVASALLLRPFPYLDPQQLVSIGAKDKAKDFGVTLLRYELVRDRSQSLQEVGVWTNDNANLTGQGEPLQAPLLRVSPNLLSLLGVQPQLGRMFTGEEGRPERGHVAILSDSIWRGRFGGDRNVVGKPSCWMLRRIPSLASCPAALPSLSRVPPTSGHRATSSIR